MVVPLTEAQQARLDDLLTDVGMLVSGNQLVERREIEDALAEEVAAELLAGDIAPQVGQFPSEEPEPSHTIVLFQDEFTVSALLPHGTQEDRKILAGNHFAQETLSSTPGVHTSRSGERPLSNSSRRREEAPNLPVRFSLSV